MSDKIHVLGFCAMILTIVVGAFAVGHDIGMTTVKQNAVNHHAAEWTVDRHGKKGFKWLNSSK